MELIKSINNDAKGFFESFNVTESIVKKCKERIYFTSFCNYFRIEEFYDGDESLAPKNLVTKSGELYSVLSSIESDIEKEITLLLFLEVQSNAIKTIGYYKYSQDPENKKKIEAAKALSMLKKNLSSLIDDEDKEDEKGEDKADQLELLDEHVNKLLLAKKASYDFDKYLKLIGCQEHKEVDDLLKDLFK